MEDSHMAKKELLTDRKTVQRGAGDQITTGKCPRCKKNCTLSSANKTGVTCRKCALQFDAQGVLIGATGASKEPVLSFELSRLEEILYRENAVIAGEDVPILLQCLLEDRGLPVPARIKKEIRDAAVERGDA